MKEEQFNGKAGRRVLTAMIVSKPVLARLRPHYDRDLFPSPWENLVAAWCCRHYDRYGTAPGQEVEALYDSWAAAHQEDKDTAVLVEKFLNELSGEYARRGEEVNAEFCIDQAGELFNQVRVLRLGEQLKDDVAKGDVAGAVARVRQFSDVNVGAGAGVDLGDKELFKQVFAPERREDLVGYGDSPLGKFMRGSFQRGDFVAFFGRTGVGKSYWLLDLAWRAHLQKRKVLFLELGDMGHDLMVRRLACRAAKRPDRAGEYLLPVEVGREKGQKQATVVREPAAWPNNMSAQEAWHACREAKEAVRLHCRPARTLTAAGLEAAIQKEVLTGWEPDVVVVDYADLLAPLDKRADRRDQINDDWILMRSLAQKYHVLLVTATQADANSYVGDKLLTLQNFSNDRRKNDHVTSMVGIAQSDAEKQQECWRLNFVKLRDGAFTGSRFVCVAGCLALSAPAMRSCF